MSYWESLIDIIIANGIKNKFEKIDVSDIPFRP